MALKVVLEHVEFDLQEQFPYYGREEQHYHHEDPNLLHISSNYMNRFRNYNKFFLEDKVSNLISPPKLNILKVGGNSRLNIVFNLGL